MDKIRISAVRYANTYPFIHGLITSGFDRKVLMEIDHPADCASKLLSGKVDIGLIPVAILPLMKEYHLLSDYCLSANGNVRTVMLLSNCSFEDIRTIYLDYRSRSSVNLSKVLAVNSWKREFVWRETSEGFDFANIAGDEAVVLIGDQCYEFETRFTNRIDLAGEWKKFSGLPFVFACWAANRELDPEFLREFNDALGTGVSDIDSVVSIYGESGIIRGQELRKYLTENIDYSFNSEKQKGLNLFLELLGKL